MKTVDREKNIFSRTYKDLIIGDPRGLNPFLCTVCKKSFRKKGIAINHNCRGKK